MYVVYIFSNFITSNGKVFMRNEMSIKMYTNNKTKFGMNICFGCKLLMELNNITVVNPTILFHIEKCLFLQYIIDFFHPSDQNTEFKIVYKMEISNLNFKKNIKQIA